MGIGMVVPIFYTQRADPITIGVRYKASWAKLESRVPPFINYINFVGFIV